MRLKHARVRDIGGHARRRRRDRPRSRSLRSHGRRRAAGGRGRRRLGRRLGRGLLRHRPRRRAHVLGPRLDARGPRGLGLACVGGARGGVLLRGGARLAASSDAFVFSRCSKLFVCAAKRDDASDGAEREPPPAPPRAEPARRNGGRAASFSGRPRRGEMDSHRPGTESWRTTAAATQWRRWSTACAFRRAPPAFSLTTPCRSYCSCSESRATSSRVAASRRSAAASRDPRQLALAQLARLRTLARGARHRGSSARIASRAFSSASAAARDELSALSARASDPARLDVRPRARARSLGEEMASSSWASERLRVRAGALPLEHELPPGAQPRHARSLCCSARARSSRCCSLLPSSASARFSAAHAACATCICAASCAESGHVRPAHHRRRLVLTDELVAQPGGLVVRLLAQLARARRRDDARSLRAVSSASTTRARAFASSRASCARGGDSASAARCGDDAGRRRRRARLEASPLTTFIRDTPAT